MNFLITLLYILAIIAIIAATIYFTYLNPRDLEVQNPVWEQEHTNQAPTPTLEGHDKG